jgi:hypothetical protein
MSIDIKKELKNPFTQQNIAEILFPFIGYLFFDWSLLIIVVFYLLDQLAYQLIFFKRLYVINMYWDDKNGWLYLITSIGFFFLVFTIELYILNQSFSYISDITGNCYLNELKTFAKNELWILFPVLLLMYYMQDKMLFYMPRRFEQYLSKTYMIHNLIKNVVILILVVVASYVYPLTNFPDLAIIFCIVSIKLIYDFTLKKLSIS